MNATEADKLMISPLQSVEFNHLAAWLRDLEVHERIEFLKRHFDHNASYRLAISTINNRNEAMELISYGLDAITKPHSQQTKGVVQFAIVKIGPSRTIREIASRMESQPHVVDMALYWIPRLLQESELPRLEFDELFRQAQVKGIIRPTRRIEYPDGSVSYADRYGD